MSERWAVEMVEALRSGGKDSGLMFAEVKSVAPLTILAHDQVISKGLYINPALLVWAEGGGSRIPLELAGLDPHPYSFLTEFHTKYVLKEGDMVVVLQVGAGFYILGEVVKVA